MADKRHDDTEPEWLVAARERPDVVLADDGEPAHPPVRLVVRPCIACGQRDDHPRHVLSNEMPRHIDCCAMNGCADCLDQLARCGTSTFPDDVMGEKLRNRLRALHPRGYSRDAAGQVVDPSAVDPSADEQEG